MKNIFYILFNFLFHSIFYFHFRCNHERDCDITAISENFGGDPCPGVPKYLEVYFGCFPGKIYQFLLFVFGLILLV